MDIGLREWLIIGGVLIIGLIIFDGWRRMKGHRNTLKMDIDRQFSEQTESEHNPELPNGGARIKAHLNPAYIPPERAFVAKPVEPKSKAVIEPVFTPERVEPSFEQMADIVEKPEIEPLVHKIDTASEAYLPENDHIQEAEDYLPEEEPGEIVDEVIKPVVTQCLAKNNAIVEDRVPEVEVTEEFDPLFDEIPDSFTKAYKREQNEYSLSTEPLSPEYDATQPSSPVVAKIEISVADNLSSVTETVELDANEDTKVESTVDSQVTYESGAAIESEIVEQIDQAETLDLEQPITVLMRQVSEQAAKREEQLSQHDMFSAIAEEIPLEPVTETSATVEPHQTTNTVTEKPKRRARQTKEPDVEVEAPEQDSLFDDLMLENARSDRKAREQVPEPEDVLVITVVAKKEPLDGHALLQVVLACGMRFGDMSLFHRFEDGIDKGAVQFSMANAVNPGTFDLEKMPSLATPGVSFFMSMSEPTDPKNAFECMLATAETVAKHLGGDLLDENRSVMRPQTKAHYRERITEYEMHHRRRRSH